VTLIAQELTQNTNARVQTLLPQGATPHDYALKPSDLKAISQADLVVWLGASSEPYLKRVLGNARAVVEWEALPQLTRLPMRSALHEHTQENYETDHSDHHEGHQHDANFDSHIWFSADNAIALVNALASQLNSLMPQQAATLSANQKQLVQRLQQQRDQTRMLLAKQERPFLLSHDAYHYLEEDLGVHSAGAILLDPDIKPGVKHLLAIKERVQKQQIRCVLTDPSVSSALLNKVDTKPAMSRVDIDPLAWDYQGTEFSMWLSSVYVKMVMCITAD
jgi:zinc transport system substrate-binding protein